MDEPVRGWRVWAWKDERLWSPIFATPWTPQRRFTAVCKDGSHLACPYAPFPGCQCGVHLAAVEDTAVTMMTALTVFIAYCPLVWGTCSGWGRVAEHRKGFRVEHAYPYELHTLERDVASEVRRVYAVDCTLS